MHRIINVSTALAALVTLVAIDGGTAAWAQLPDPDDAKAADKCQKAILSAGAAFTASTLKSLSTCFDGVFKCIQTKPDDDKCVPKAVARCAKENDASRAKRVAKISGAITKKCTSLADLKAAGGLDYVELETGCANAGTPLTTVAAVADCAREAARVSRRAHVLGRDAAGANARDRVRHRDRAPARAFRISAARATSPIRTSGSRSRSARSSSRRPARHSSRRS